MEAVSTPVSRIVAHNLITPKRFEDSKKLSYSITFFIGDALAQDKDFKSLQGVGVKRSDTDDGWLVTASAGRAVPVIVNGVKLDLKKVHPEDFRRRYRRGVAKVRIDRKAKSLPGEGRLQLQEVTLEFNFDLTRKRTGAPVLPGGEYAVDRGENQANEEKIDATLLWIAEQEKEDDTPEKTQRKEETPMPKKEKPKPKKEKPVKKTGPRYPKVSPAALLDISKDISGKPTYFADIETECPEDENYGVRGYIGAAGSSRYLRHKGTTLLMAKAKRQGRDEIIDLTKTPLPPGSRAVWHRAEFDVDGLAMLDGIDALHPSVEVADTKVLAAYCNFPDTGLGNALDFYFGGSIRKGTMPRRKDYDDERKFLADMDEYLLADLRGPEQLYAACRFLIKVGVGKKRRQEVWERILRHTELSLKINRRGLPRSRPILEAGAACKARIFEECDALMMQKLGFKASNKEKVIGWLREHGHLPPTKEKTPKGDKMSYKRKFLAPLLDTPGLVGDIARACHARGSTMLAKYEAALARTDDDDRLRHAYHMYGADSHRFTSSGGCNSQNDPRASGKTLAKPEEFATATAQEAQNAIRRSYEAPEGRLLARADYSQVEFRAMAHLAGRDDAFAIDPKTGKTRDIHTEVAALAYHGGDQSKVVKAERQIAKGAVYGSQYHVGPTKLAATLKIPLADAEKLLSALHELYPELRDFRQKLMRFWTGQAHKKDQLPCGLEFGCFTINGREVRLWRRPSGDVIFYWDCKGSRYLTLSASAAEYDAKGNPVLHKTGENKGKPKKIMGLGAHPGTLAAHVVSSICVDILMHGMEALDRKLAASGLDAHICGHTHDEVILDCAEADAHKALALMKETLVVSPPWMPNINLETDGAVRKYLTGADIEGTALALDDAGNVVSVSDETEE